MFKKSLAAALVAALFCCISPAHAGTTGTLTGRVVDAANNAPLSGVKVDAASASQTASAITDAAGTFTMLSLGPDTYSVSVQKTGYEPQSQAGVSVFADQSAVVSFALRSALKEIGAVRSSSSASLVRGGTTSDVYSVNAAGQRASQALGGSGSLDQAYSAIASVPGVNIPTGQQGWYQSVFIRGGDYDQVAYEFDGVPVIRESDGAPIVTLSALGQQEVQVYTGGTPATSDSPGLAGYINQVIKTGTHPGFGQITAAIGGPAFYHKLAGEVSGATPNRLFSYYIGFAGANQDYRYGDQSNGAGDPLYSYPLYIPTTNASYNLLDGTCGVQPVLAACTAKNFGAYFSPGNSWTQQNNQDRETVANFHIGVPHHHDAGRDDVQLLYVTGNIFTTYFSSANQLGAANVVTAPGSNPFWPGYPFPYLDGIAYNGALMAPPDPAQINSNALFPSSPQQRTPLSPVPPTQNDGGSNGYSVEKAQYQRNINDHSYVRAIAYGEYSNWFLNGPNSSQLTFGATLSDYEVEAWIYGGSLIYSNNLSNKHLLTTSLSYSTQKLQTYNATFTQGSNTGQFGSIISNYMNPNGNGTCYNFTTGLPWSCYDAASQGSPTNLTPGTAPVGTPGANAQWLMTENGQSAQVDNVTPYFSSIAATDVYKPNSKLTVNAGVRMDRFSYKLDDLSSRYPARQFWFNAYNNEFCTAPGVSDVSRWNGSTFGACPSGYVARTTPGFQFVNSTGGTTTDYVFQPRIAFTYQVNPNTVLRGSYGRYARPAATSYHQYNTFEQDLPSFMAQFAALGYTSPVHDVRPDTSDNFDLSYEHRIPGTSVSFKASPFYRTTKNQLQYLNISALGGTLAGVNVGTLRSYGLEFAVKAGDFDRDGFSGQFSYTYTNTHIKYGNFANGLNIIDVLNSSIQQYNSYTSACAPAGPGGTYTAQQRAMCGIGANSANGQASFTGADQSGNPIAINNPYYNQPAQPLLDRSAEYVPYDVIPNAFASANSYAVPNVASLVLNYKHKAFSITPSLTYNSGSYYGSPLSVPGYVPQACSPPTGVTPNPPNTPGLYCGSGGAIFIPDPFTGNKFDNMGSLREPSQLTMNLQMAYDVTPKSTLTFIATGLYNHCYQRGYAWDTQTACIYSSLPSNILPPSGNFLAPSQTPVQVLYPYGNWFNNTQVGITSARQPFNMVLNYQIKI